jgi:hypothetical protein
MHQSEVIATVERRPKAERAGDAEGAVACYTDDIVHDAVGFPGSPARGRRARGTSPASSRPIQHRDRTAASPVLRRRPCGPRTEHDGHHHGRECSGSRHHPPRHVQHPPRVRLPPRPHLP